MSTIFHIRTTWLALLLGSSAIAQGQVVGVTMRLDTNLITAGDATTLRVFAQILPGYRTNSDRIFSWYLDVLNTNGGVARANYSAMRKSASDSEPQTSSTGFDEGANRRAVFDTFRNLPGAGRDAPVELMAIPITGLTQGRTRFSARAGSGAPQLSEDFIVAPLGGGEPLTGGDYSLAQADLNVICVLRLTTARLTNAVGQTTGVRLSFTLCPGQDHTVEFTESLRTPILWQPLAGAPHNSGSVTVTNSGSQRFYRVRANLRAGGFDVH